MKETPAQTFERITNFDWPGGKSFRIIILLRVFGITAAPGSAEANLELQRKLEEQENFRKLSDVERNDVVGRRRRGENA